MRKLTALEKILFTGMLIIILIVGIIFYFLFFKNITTGTKNIIVSDNQINFDSLSLKQKIAQMIIVRGDDNKNIELTRLNVGGIFLDRQKSEEDYYLTKGAVFCELKVTDEGLNLVLKNYGFSNKHFTIKMDDNIVFQKLTSQELVILSALDHLSD